MASVPNLIPRAPDYLGASEEPREFYLRVRRALDGCVGLLNALITSGIIQQISGGGLVFSINHAKLFNLDYSDANHTNFAGTLVSNTFTMNQLIETTDISTIPLFVERTSAFTSTDLFNVTMSITSGTPHSTQVFQIVPDGSIDASTVQVIVSGWLDLTNGSSGVFTSPASGSFQTKILFPLLNPGANDTLLALGLPSSANATSMLMGLFDARSVAHTPTICVFSPNEAQTAGISWEGTNLAGYLKSSAGVGLLGTNATFFGPGDWQSGVGVVFLADKTTAPTGNPSGGLDFYSSGGLLHYRGVNGDDKIAIIGTGTNSTAVGPSAVASATRSTSLGSSATANITDGTALGYNALSQTAAGVAVGSGATCSGGVAVGVSSTASAGGVAVGSSSTATGNNSIAVGTNSSVTVNNAFSFGASNTVSHAGGQGYGNTVSVTSNGFMCVGQNLQSTHFNSIVMGISSGSGYADSQAGQWSYCGNTAPIYHDLAGLDSVQNNAMARLKAEYVVSTHASFTCRSTHWVADVSAFREYLRGETSGSAPMIGFLGTAAAVQQTGGPATAGALYTATEQGMLQTVYNALRTFGLLS